MKVPWYQRSARLLAYTFVGIGLLGNILDHVNNAISLITPTRTYYGTGIIILFWVLAQFALRRNPLRWVLKEEGETRLHRLGISPTLTLMGMILLLWCPRLIDSTKETQTHNDATSVTSGNSSESNLAGRQPDSDEHNGKVVVLVANFQGPDQDYGVTQIIFNQLEELEAQYPDVSVKSLNEIITAQDGSNAAQEKGRQHQANVVLWGFYIKNDSNVYVTAMFELIDRPKLRTLIKKKESFQASVSQLKNFKIQERLSSDMRYLTLITMGLARFEVEDYEGAIARLTDALTLQQAHRHWADTAEIRLFRGLAHHFKNELDQASEDYTEVLKLKPSSKSVLVDCYANRGLVHLWKGDNTNALKDFNIAIALAPDAAEVYNNRGLLLVDEDKFDLGIKDFTKALSLRPESALVYLTNLGMAYYYKGDLDLALSEYTKAINLPDAKDYPSRLCLTYFDRALAYDHKKEFGKALEDYNQAVSLCPDRAENYNNRATVYITTNELDLAVADCNKAIILNPNFADAFHSRAIAFDRRGDIGLALADYNCALQLDPTNPDIYHNRGKANAKINNFPSAINDFNRTIAMKPDNAEAYFDRGVYYQEQGDLDRAMSDYTKAIEIDPDSIQALNNRGWLYLEKRQSELALKDYNRAIEIEPNYSGAILNRAIVHLIQGNKEMAIVELNKAIQVSNNPQVMARAQYILELLKKEK